MLRGRRTGSSFLADLRSVLQERDFRRLFATRLISQTGDGVFTAGLGSYVFFNTATFPDPARGAAAFAVLYLPYSLIGPFAGVFIDRWSRRQILVWSALLRSVFVVLTAAVMAAGNHGPPLYIAVLLVLGVNRVFLVSLAAGLAAAAGSAVGGGGPGPALPPPGGFRFLCGILFLRAILLYGNSFSPSGVPRPEPHFAPLVPVSGIGSGCAALVIPPLTRRL